MKGSTKDYLSYGELEVMRIEQGYDPIDSLSPLSDINLLEQKVKPGQRIIILGKDGKTREMTFLAYQGEGDEGGITPRLYSIGRVESNPGQGQEIGSEICIGSDEFTNQWSFGWKVLN